MLQRTGLSAFAAALRSGFGGDVKRAPVWQREAVQGRDAIRGTLRVHVIHEAKTLARAVLVEHRLDSRDCNRAEGAKQLEEIEISAVWREIGHIQGVLLRHIAFDPQQASVPDLSKHLRHAAVVSTRLSLALAAAVLLLLTPGLRCWRRGHIELAERASIAFAANGIVSETHHKRIVEPLGQIAVQVIHNPLSLLLGGEANKR